MPTYSPLDNPLVFVPGSAVTRNDGRFILELEGVGNTAFVRTLSPRPFVCSVLGLPRPIGTAVLNPFAAHPAVIGVSLCEEGWDLLTIAEEPVLLMLWPQNTPGYRAPGEPEPPRRPLAAAW